MVNSADFSTRLENIMEYYEINAAAFAEAIDFNRSTISHLLSGRNKPSLEFVMKVLQKFPEVDMNWLVSGKGDFPTSRINQQVKSQKAIPERPNETKKATLDLFSDLPPNSEKNEADKNLPKEIERIIIFYTDGSFKGYEN